MVTLEQIEALGRMIELFAALGLKGREVEDLRLLEELRADLEREWLGAHGLPEGELRGHEPLVIKGR
jgi:hypothetical protein